MYDPTNLWISTRWSHSELTTSSFFSPECRLFPVRFQLFFSSLAWHTKVHIIQKYVERSVDGKEKHRHQHFYCRDATLIDQVCVSVGKRGEENREAGQVKQVGRSSRTKIFIKWPVHAISDELEASEHVFMIKVINFLIVCRFLSCRHRTL